MAEDGSIVPHQDIETQISSARASTTGPGIRQIAPFTYHQTAYGPTHLGDGSTVFQGDVQGGLHIHQNHQATIDRFVQSLSPEVVLWRKNDIADTKYNNFGWVFDDHAMEKVYRRTRFVAKYDRCPMDDSYDESLLADFAPLSQRMSYQRWLVSSPAGQHFLVIGKPGSGKSTFMKFLSNHDSTVRLLTDAYKGKTPVVLFHTFWAATSIELQHNHEGLLRSLLHQILTRVNSFPDRLKGRLLCCNKPLLEHRDRRDFSHLIENLMRTLDRPILLFIDGLDEFKDQRHDDDLFEFIASMERMPQVKVCLSSRPEPHILNRFEDPPNIRLQDLTWDDVYTTAHNTLQDKCKGSRAEMSPAVSNLAVTIALKAEGVFLWSQYVLKNVCRGLLSYEDINDLTRRVDELPPDMDDLYKLMLVKMQTMHGIHMQTTRRLLSSCQDLPRAAFKLMVMTYPDLSEHYLSNMTCISEGELSQRFEKFLSQLPMISAGLLEVFQRKTSGYVPPVGFHKRLITLGRYDSTLNASDTTPVTNIWVRYIHRTVQDFVSRFATDQCGELYADSRYQYSRVRAVAQLGALIEGDSCLTLHANRQYGDPYFLIKTLLYSLQSEPGKPGQLLQHLAQTLQAIVLRNARGLEDFLDLRSTPVNVFLALGGIFNDFAALLASCTTTEYLVRYLQESRSFSRLTTYYWQYLTVCKLSATYEGVQKSIILDDIVAMMLNPLMVLDSASAWVIPMKQRIARLPLPMQPINVRARTVFGHFASFMLERWRCLDLSMNDTPNLERLKHLPNFVDSKCRVGMVLEISRLGEYWISAHKYNFDIVLNASRLLNWMIQLTAELARPGTCVCCTGAFLKIPRACIEDMIIYSRLGKGSETWWTRLDHSLWGEALQSLDLCRKQQPRRILCGMKLPFRSDCRCPVRPMPHDASWSLNPGWENDSWYRFWEEHLPQQTWHIGDPKIPDLEWAFCDMDKEYMHKNLVPLDPYQEVPPEKWREYSVYRKLYAELDAGRSNRKRKRRKNSDGKNATGEECQL